MPSGGAIFGNRRHGAEKRADLARAIAFRESRRCRRCGALGYVPCAHRDNADDAPKPAPAFPFRDHRTCAEWMGLAAVRETPRGGELLTDSGQVQHDASLTHIAGAK